MPSIDTFYYIISTVFTMVLLIFINEATNDVTGNSIFPLSINLWT